MISDSLLRISSLIVTASVILTTLQDLSLFSAHPISMVLFMYMGVEGSIALAKKTKAKKTPAASSSSEGSGNAKVSRAEQIDVHASLMFAAVAACAIGFSVIYYIKDLNNKPHFATRHGLLGSLFATYALFQSIAGYVARQLKVSPKIWRIHRFSGGFLLASIIFVSYLHLATMTPFMKDPNWMMKNQYFMGWGLIGQISLVVSGLGVFLRVL
ncbi:hypothetical protein HDU76_010408 [Blyttiomyces sp. JEL0837]|nr:hypothetical protein HDU76_010408 [Blyttiomyces sp. JEL0837]